MSKPIEEEWQKLAEKALPPGVSKSSVQYREMQKAFFAGVIFMHTKVLELEGASDEELTEFLQALEAEIEGFVLHLKTLGMGAERN